MNKDDGRDWKFVLSAVGACAVALAVPSYWYADHASADAETGLEGLPNSVAMSDSSLDAAEPATGAAGGMWSFTTQNDRMRNQTSIEASLRSLDQEIMINLRRRNGEIVRATIDFGTRLGPIILCGDECEITASFDGQLATFLAHNLDERPGKVVGLFDPKGFEQHLRRARDVIVELQLDSGTVQYEFRAGSLDWSQADSPASVPVL